MDAQQADRGLVPVRGGPEQRRPPVAIFCIDFGPAVEKQLCHGLVPVLGRSVQWSPPVPVLGFEIGTIKDEKCYRNSLFFSLARPRAGLPSPSTAFMQSLDGALRKRMRIIEVEFPAAAW